MSRTFSRHKIPGRCKILAPPCCWLFWCCPCAKQGTLPRHSVEKETEGYCGVPQEWHSNSRFSLCRMHKHVTVPRPHSVTEESFNTKLWLTWNAGKHCPQGHWKILLDSTAQHLPLTCSEGNNKLIWNVAWGLLGRQALGWAVCSTQHHGPVLTAACLHLSGLACKAASGFLKTQAPCKTFSVSVCSWPPA